MRTAPHPALALAAALALAGCGGAPRPDAGGPAADPEGSAVPPLPAPGAFYTAGLPAYAADGWILDPAEQALSHDLGRALAPPPALDCLAREYAARFAADGRDPDPGTVAALAHHCGYWTRPATPYSVTAPDAAALAEHARKLPPVALEGTVGLGVARHPDGPMTLTLLRDPGEVRLDAPVARETAAGRVAGRLVRGDGRLELWVDGDEGPQRIELAVTDVGRFDGAIPAGARRVELARKQGNFRRTVALFDRGPRATGYAPPPTTPAPAAEQTADGLIDRVNALRSAAGLPPLTHEARLDPVLDDWLHRVADRTADDTPPGMLDPRGWPYARLRYAISSGRDAAQIVDLLVETPTGRRAVLTDEVDRVAVGLRPFDDGRGFDAVFAAVQGFTPMPPEAARAALLGALNAARTQDGSAPLASSPVLTAVAQRLAEEALAGRRAWGDVVPGAMEAIKAEKLVRGAFAAGAFPTATIEGAPFEQEPGAMAADVRHIGIGVIGGPLPDGGAPRYLVVYVVAEAVAARDI